MLDTLFRGLFDTALTDTIAPVDFLLCIDPCFWDCCCAP